MKIAICDDEEIFLSRVETCFSSQPDCTLECFSSPSMLLEKYQAGERYDVLFLDVLMEPLDGIALAREIRTYDDSAVLVFLTSCLDYAPSGYEVKAFRYLLKPVTKEAIHKVMEEIRAEFLENKRIQVRTPECSMCLPVKSILYLEIDDKETTIYYDSDTLVLRKGLTEFTDSLPESLFYRIHRKYVVNLSRVREYDASRLTLENGKTLPIGRRRSRDFLNAIEHYITEGK